MNSASFEESRPFCCCCFCLKGPDFIKQGEYIPVSYILANHWISSHHSRSRQLAIPGNSSYCEIIYSLQNKCPAPSQWPGVRVYCQATGRAAAVVWIVPSTTGRRKPQPTLDMPWMIEPLRACLRCHSVCKHTQPICSTTWQNNPSECLLAND